MIQFLISRSNDKKYLHAVQNNIYGYGGRNNSESLYMCLFLIKPSYASFHAELQIIRDICKK